MSGLYLSNFQKETNSLLDERKTYKCMSLMMHKTNRTDRKIMEDELGCWKGKPVLVFT